MVEVVPGGGAFALSHARRAARSAATLPGGARLLYLKRYLAPGVVGSGIVWTGSSASRVVLHRVVICHALVLRFAVTKPFLCLTRRWEGGTVCKITAAPYQGAFR